MKIHKEGYTTIVLIMAFIGFVNYLNFYFIPFLSIQVVLLLISLVFFYLILHFFRNPIRNVQLNDQHIIAPSDGKLVVKEEVFESESTKEEVEF